jgi:microcystin-dependent protein
MKFVKPFSAGRVQLNLDRIPMKTHDALAALFRAAATPSILALALALVGSRALAQSTPEPPNRMTYQGFLTDANGVPLGETSPQNFDVIFRIHDDQSAGQVLWGEQQTVTVDNGNFSVLLGEGADSGDPRPVISTVFVGPTASDRYVGMTVKGIGNGGSDVNILPRLRMLASPYSFLAKNSTALVSPNGSTLVSAANGELTINGQVNATTLTGNGSGLTSLPNFAALRTGGNTFTGDQLVNATVTANAFSGNGGALTALNGANINNGTISVEKLAAAVQRALCPPGTILSYAGDTAPPGWLLCTGTFGNNPAAYPELFAVIGYRFGGFTSGGIHWFLTPDLRGRFLRGRDAGAGRDPDRAARTATYPEGATGDNVGSVQGDQFRRHTHTETRFLDSGNDPARSTPGGDDVGQLQTANTGAAGGNETRPVNMYVNYIIKY